MMLLDITVCSNMMLPKDVRLLCYLPLLSTVILRGPPCSHIVVVIRSVRPGFLSLMHLCFELFVVYV